MKALKAKRLYTGTHFIDNAALVWDGKYIIDAGPEDILKQYSNISLTHTNSTIIPGFVDIQVNGAGGADFYGEGLTLSTLQKMAETLRTFGCTSFCPTLITSTDDDILKALNLANTSNFEDLGIPGLHIEGPMFSFEHKGAHNPELLRVLKPEIIDKIIASKVAIVSLSPEVAPLPYISRLSRAGVRVSIAHTNGSLSDVRRAETHGASMGTHLYNGMSRFSSREPNVVGGLLTSKVLTPSIIPDGLHSDFESVKLAHRILGERLITITDGIVAMGTNMKKFKLGFQWVHVDEHNRCMGDYGGLAGSMVTPIECLQNLVSRCDYSLAEALHSYTYAPAKALGQHGFIGCLCPGAWANFSFLDETSLSLEKTVFQGK